MKTNIPSLAIRAATLGLGLLFLPTLANAQSRQTWGRQSTGHESRHFDEARHDNDGRQRYLSRPRSSFSLSFGTGYAGRGYYYGPPSAYYYERPGVMFYRSWESVPYSYRRYSSAPRNGNVISVQQALARLGFYRGPIDGDAGPGTRDAIIRFEERNGMPVTGVITTRLMQALNVD
jgi:hypothetical protein